MTETFIFTVVIMAAAITVPLFFTGSYEGWLSKPQDEAAKVILARTAEQLADSVKATQQTIATTPPIPYLKRLPNVTPYILPVLNYLFVHLPYVVGSFVFSLLYVPISYVLTIVARVLAPVWILLEVTFDVFVWAPYHALVWVATLLYPIYVFCGVAALVGAMLGLLGVGLGNLALYLTSKLADAAREDGILRDTKGKAREQVPGSAVPARSTRTAIKIEEDSSRHGRRVEFVD